MRPPSKEIPTLTPRQFKNFWSKVDIKGPDECWNWTGSRDKKWNYGQFRVYPSTYKAHRIAWSLEHGSPPPDQLLRHGCNNTLCCNPRHMLLGDDKSNKLDSIISGTAKMPNGGYSLLPETVNQIRDLAKSKSHAAIAREMGLSQPFITRIINRQRYAYVT